MLYYPGILAGAALIAATLGLIALAGRIARAVRWFLAGKSHD
jgi:hypothetical protein